MTVVMLQPILTQMKATNDTYKEMSWELKVKASAQGVGAVNEDNMW